MSTVRNAFMDEVKIQPTMCEVHSSQPLVLYCETCERLVCRDCALISCRKKDHVYDFIEDVTKKYQEDVRGKLEQAKSLLREMSGKLDMSLAGERELAGVKDAELKQVGSTFDALHEILKHEREYFTASLEKLHEKQVDAYSTNQNKLTKICEKLESIIRSVEKDSLSSKPDFLGKLSRDTEQEIAKISEFASSIPRDTEQSSMEKVELISPAEFKQLWYTRNYIFREADPLVGNLERFGDMHGLHRPHKLTLHLKPQREGTNRDMPDSSKLQTSQNITAHLHCCRDASEKVVDVQEISPEKYSLSVIPWTRGKHELRIKCDESHVCGSPIQLHVTVEPDKLKMLHANSFCNVAAIKSSQRKIFATEDKKSLMVLDRLATNVEKVINILGICEFAIDCGHIYATDDTLHRLIKTDMEGVILKSVGTKGTGPGKFDFPNGVRISKVGEIYVCDTNNKRIQVFDKELNLLRIIGSKYTKAEFGNPNDLFFDEVGNIYVTEQQYHCIQVLTPVGDHIRDIATGGFNRGQLDNPITCVIHKGLLYVTDIGNRRISVFKTSGEFVGTFGEDVLTDPECICIDDDGYIFVTNNRATIVVF